MKDILKYAVLSLLAALVTACDKVPLLAPSGSVIALSANALTVPANGTVGLTAFVTESSGTPVQNGTTVRFTTTLGTVSPSEVQTTNGIAVATFQAGAASGVAQVQAISGGGSGTTAGGGAGATVTATNVVQITVGAAAVSSVAVTANPGSVPAAGGTVQIVATALGGGTSANVPIPNVAVSFSTTAGTLSATSAVTDASGQARVNLTTSRKATVTASVGAQTKTVDVTPTASPSLTLATSPASPTLGQAVILTITPIADTAPSVVVDWGDGTSTSLGVIRSAQSVAHTYRSAGNFAITATATEDGSTSSASSAVNIAPPPSVAITATPSSGPAATTTFAFNVTPATANGVKDVTIDFGDGSTQDLGAITSAATVTHRFAAGTYTVKATETDGNGNTTTAIAVITAS